MSRSYIFSSESVGEGHPDKVCDTISDAILDACLSFDPKSRVACETFAKSNIVVVGGETVAEGFKRLKLGPVIGKTTQGAGVWLSDRNRLMDNGILRAAETAQLGLSGEVLVEGTGVTPDIEVDNPPRATAAGQDAQLEAAVAHLLKQLTASTPVQRGPRVKAYPRPRG